METQTEPIGVERRYPAAPLVGVGVVVLNARGEVLLAQRGKPPRQGEWSLPGGLIDLGERLADAAVREVREECAIEIAIGGLIAPFEPIVHDADGRIEYHYVILDFWAKHLRGEAVAQDDATAVAWVPMNQLANYNLRRDTRRMIEDGYALWYEAGGAVGQETVGQ
ncbi:MAG: NUDIX hydrolase [Caldilineaceae bacterium]|nr:NUDIX hydrolase [Caldilineaceae bacterium]